MLEGCLAKTELQVEHWFAVHSSVVLVLVQRSADTATVAGTRTEPEAVVV